MKSFLKMSTAGLVVALIVSCQEMPVASMGSPEPVIVDIANPPPHPSEVEAIGTALMPTTLKHGVSMLSEDMTFTPGEKKVPFVVIRFEASEKTENLDSLSLEGDMYKVFSTLTLTSSEGKVLSTVKSQEGTMKFDFVPQSVPQGARKSFLLSGDVIAPMSGGLCLTAFHTRQGDTEGFAHLKTQ